LEEKKLKLINLLIATLIKQICLEIVMHNLEKLWDLKNNSKEK